MKFFVVVAVFVSHDGRVGSVGGELRDRVLEASLEPTNCSDHMLSLPKQQRPGVRRDVFTIALRHVHIFPRTLEFE